MQIRQKSSSDGQLGKDKAHISVDVSLNTLHAPSGMAITRISHDGAGIGMSDPLPAQAAALVAFHLQPLLDHELWVDGQPVANTPLAQGMTSVVNLTGGAVARLGSAFDCSQIYLPLATAHSFSVEHELPCVLQRPLLEMADPVLAQMGQLCAFLVNAPEQMNSLLEDAVVGTVLARLAHAHGWSLPSVRIGAGLAPWQLRRAKEMIDASIANVLRLEELAAACGLSTGHFSRAFKQSTGMPPYRWLQQRRIDRAKQFLIAGQLSLAEVALVCGFTDQSHLSRQFRRVVGTPPAQWRRGYG